MRGNTYGREYRDQEPFPHELAVLIVRKAVAMAEKFEGQAIDQMTRDARRALRDGAELQQIMRELDL